jgi:hypothetical protein
LLDSIPLLVSIALSIKAKLFPNTADFGNLHVLFILVGIVVFMCPNNKVLEYFFFSSQKFFEEFDQVSNYFRLSNYCLINPAYSNIVIKNV